MSEPTDNSQGPVPQPGEPGGGNPNLFSEQLKHTPVGARLPEGVAHGVFASGALVLEGPDECVIDFVQGVSRPPRMAVRVILSWHVAGLFAAALKENLQKYEQAFGPPKAMPKPKIDRPPSFRDIYNELKISDEQLNGVYATTVMIGHSPSDFLFDFITRFFPTAAVAARVYMSASQVPGLLTTVSSSLQHHLARTQQPQPPQAPQAQQPPQGPQEPPQPEPPRGEGPAGSP